MKNTILFSLIGSCLLIMSSCKKDYSCYGSETLEFELYADSTQTNAGIYVEHKFEAFETCINCTKKDKDKLLQMILEYIVRQEDEKKAKYESLGSPIKKETFIENELICEEK